MQPGTLVKHLYVTFFLIRKKGAYSTYADSQKTCRFSLAKLLNDSPFNKLEMPLPNNVIKGAAQQNMIVHKKKKFNQLHYSEKDSEMWNFYKVLGAELKVSFSLYHVYDRNRP